MENLFLPYLSLAIVLLISAYFYLSRSKTTKSPNLLPPPGRRAVWPLVGESLDYLSNLKNGSLEKFVQYRREKYSSDVFIASLMGYPMAFLCGAEGNKFLFTNEERLLRVWFPPSLEKIFQKRTQNNIPFNEDLKISRKLLLFFLKPSALQNSVHKMDMLMKQQMMSFAGDGDNGGIVTAQKIAGSYTMAVACKLLLGVSEPGWIENLQGLMKDIAGGLLAIPINVPGTAFNRAVKAGKVIHKIMEDMIKKRRIDLLKEPTRIPVQDILSHMVLYTEEDGTKLTEAHMASRFMGFMHAGFDPTRAGLTLIIKYLAEFPDVYGKVKREQMDIAKSKGESESLNWEDISKMKYSWNVACEVFRLMPPVAGTFREAVKDFTYHGHAIAKGTKIHWLAQSTHNDSNYFSDAHKFDPSRFERNEFPSYSYVPFGGGPRMCPAQDYAKLLTLVFIHNMVINFEWELVIPDEKIVFDPHPRPVQGLPIRFVFCKP